MPRPVSVTEMSTRPSGLKLLLRVTSPPARLYLTALDSRLVNTCFRRVTSASTPPAAGSNCSRRRNWRCSARPATMPRQAATIGCSSSGSSVSCTAPDSMRARSRVSLIRSSRCQPARWICCVHSRWWAANAGSRSRPSNWAKPIMALSGVRSSWLMRDRNSLLAWLAASACCSARSDASRRRCSVMSSTTATMRSVRPLASRMAVALTRAVMLLSRRRTASTTLRASPRTRSRRMRRISPVSSACTSSATEWPSNWGGVRPVMAHRRGLHSIR